MSDQMTDYKFRKEAAPEEYPDWKVYGVYLRHSEQRIGWVLDSLSRGVWHGYWGPEEFPCQDPNDAPDETPPMRDVGPHYGRDAAAEAVVAEHHRREVAKRVLARVGL